MSTNQPDMAPELNALCLEWHHAKEAAERAIAYEKSLRARIAAEVFEVGGELRKGTERRHIQGGIQIKHVGKLNYSFTSRDELDAVLDEIEQMGPEGLLLAGRIVKFTPSLSVTEYEKAPEEIKRKITEILVTKQGSPELEIERPKA